MTEQEELSELRRRVEQARLTVEEDAAHDLSYGHVMAILSMYGPRLEHDIISVEQARELGINPEEHRAGLIGWKRRAWNALLCAEKILPLWSVEVVEPYLSPKSVQQLRHLSLKDLIVESKIAVLLEERLPIRNFEPSVDDLSYRLVKPSQTSHRISQAVTTYGTIWKILFIVSTDEFNVFDPERKYSETWEDDDVDWMGAPSAIRASYAFAGRAGGRYGNLNDPDARREFWLWWLDEAVLSSWKF
ncbi:hypothetical protein IAD21_03802 [Abditibacteriota bacterium]|nr:hypothetical protein IAD21_03802 [Abditibacteriota bacterium]